jgi:hypothetical protein
MEQLLAAMFHGLHHNVKLDGKLQASKIKMVNLRKHKFELIFVSYVKPQCQIKLNHMFVNFPLYLRLSVATKASSVARSLKLAKSILLIPWMGDHQRRPDAVNLITFVGVDLNL